MSEQKLDNQPEMMQDSSQETTNKSGKKAIYTVISISVIILAMIAGLTWLYTGKLNNIKKSTFKILPLPAAFVEFKPILAKEAIKRIELANKLVENKVTTEAINPEDLFTQLLENKKIEVLASKHNLAITQAMLDEEYDNVIHQYAQGDAKTFEDQLQNVFQMDKQQFKEDIIKPTVFITQLAIWYNNQENFNKKSFETIHSIQEQLDKGVKFEDLAKQYNQDQSSKDFAGDSGMIVFNDLLPEFREGLKDVKVGDTKVVTSRSGYHVLKVLEMNDDGPNGSKQIHLQQIFIQPQGFSDWLKQQLDSLKTFKFLKF